MIKKSTIGMAFLGALLQVAPPYAVATQDPAWEETEALKAFEAQSNRWTFEAAQHLVTQDQPILRILGTNILLLEHYRPAGMTDRKAAQDYHALRKQALEDGWSDPAVLLHVYARDCHGDDPVSWCDPAALQAQFQRVDPDNALGPLMPLIWPKEWFSKPDLTPEIEAMLGEAAGKARFDLHHGAGAYDAWLVMKQFASVHRPPEMPEELWKQMRAQPWEGMDLWLASGVVTMVSPDLNASWIDLLHVCVQAREHQRDEAVEACRNLGEMMRGRARSEISRGIGAGLVHRMTAPEADNAGQAPAQPILAYERVEVQVRACRTPKLPGQLWKMPADHWPRFLKDQQEAGEVAAMQRAAQREYALYPELFAWDPAECDSIYELDDEQRKELGMKMEELRGVRIQKAVENQAE